MITLLLLACGSDATSSTPVEHPAAKTEHAEPAAKGKRTDTDIAGLEKALADKALVIDVRTQPEWDAGHVPGAVHIEMPVPPDHPVLKEHGKDEPIYVVCQVGGRSSRVADALAAKGYQTVNVQGGTGAWIEAGKEVER